MSIRPQLIISLSLVLAASLAAPGLAGAEEPEGLKIFKAQHCDECHTINSLGVKLSASEKKDEKDKDEKEPPDLSGAGLEHDAAWMRKYLKKSVKKEGKEHRKRFKGSKSELETITTWLETLKTKPEKSEKKGK
ncbi:MAG: c-type cytochrome [Oligoflexia bacterium]|nr:c-type cytochrome [Oligoflexia bacterium]